MSWQGGRFAEGIVAGESQNAAVGADSGEVGVAEGVAGAIDAGAFAIPEAEDAVVFGLGKGVGELAAVNRGGGDIFVDAGEELDVVLAQEIALAFERSVVAAEMRAAVASDKRSGVESEAAVGAMLIEG